MKVSKIEKVHIDQIEHPIGRIDGKLPLIS
ncbi:hypothetical protein J2Z40_002018 [Cytobacillus eiseniae]|uniref:Uncharacterized protein n=1 Tax=Cytobacillus eiseniae TaxID=762947 RepID=A0ABS4RGG7_9BACI|nr:hypothetical protein [Cytobacillus eiseniae]